MDVDIITLFPDIFSSVLREGMIRIAIEKGKLHVRVHDLREYTDDKHRSVDDRPFGGGPGMVLKPEPVFRAVEATAGKDFKGKYIMLSPQGRALSQPVVEELAAEERLLFLCGRYEGYDERIREGFDWDEVSIGDYVTTGGDIPAMVIIDAVVRFIPGVLGDERSAREDSFASGMLDHPQYTRPVEFRGMKVPEVLMSGDHAKIAAWREAEGRRRTADRRPDLLNNN